MTDFQFHYNVGFYMAVFITALIMAYIVIAILVAEARAAIKRLDKKVEELDTRYNSKANANYLAHQKLREEVDNLSDWHKDFKDRLISLTKDVDRLKRPKMTEEIKYERETDSEIGDDC